MSNSVLPGPFLHKRGTTAKILLYAGPLGELVVDSTTYDLYVQTGSAGGIRLLKSAARVTAGDYGPSSGAVLPNGGSFTVPYVTVNADGLVTGISTKAFTLPSSSYTLPIAGATTLGGIRVGDNLDIDADGVLSTTITAGTNTPYADAPTAAVGISNSYARADHVHPLSEYYAAASHSHSAADITSGVLVAARGGTGRDDGMVSDVYLSGSGANTVTAKGVGQLGEAVTKDAVNANTLTTSGTYFCINNTRELNYPWLSDSLVKVKASGSYIYQEIVLANSPFSYKAYRYSTNSGTSWSSWDYQYHGTSVYSIYIAKAEDGGSNSNLGTSSDKPLLTVEAALDKATRIGTTSTLYLRFGSGDWGDITLQANSISAGRIRITNFDDAGNNTTAPSVMPHFGTIQVYDGTFEVRNLKCDSLRAVSNAYLTTGSYCEIGHIESLRKSVIQSTGVLKIYDYEGSSVPSIMTLADSYFESSGTIDVSAVQRSSVFLNVAGIATVFMNNTTFTGTATNCRKYAIGNGTAFIRGVSPEDYPAGVAGTGYYVYNGLPQQGVVLTSGNQSIAGIKSFTDNLIIDKAIPQIIIKNNNITKGTNPSQSTQYSYLNFGDSGANSAMTATNRIGLISSTVNTNGNTALSFYAYQNSATDVDNVYCSLFISADATNKYFSVPDTKPIANNTYNLGAANLYWKDAFVGSSSPISHSDERIKSNITPISDTVLDAWGEVQWYQFQFNDAITEKGTDARIHVGAVVQRIKRIFESRNINPARYGLYCYDSWEAEDWDETIIDKKAVKETIKVVDQEAQYDNEGNEISPEISHEEEHVIEPEVSHVEHHHKDAGDIYSLRYGECFAMEASYLRRCIKRLLDYIKSLEARIEVLENK